MIDIYCPQCGEYGCTIIRFDKFYAECECRTCGYNATYENVDKGALILREMVDDIKKRADKEIKASPVDWSKPRSYPMPFEDSIVKGGSHE